MLPEDLLNRLRARAEDPARRTDAAGSMAGSTGFVTALDQGGLAEEQHQAMQGLLDQFADVFKNVRVMAPGLSADDVQPRAAEALPAPVTAEQLGAAEAAIGRRLPDALRQLYAIADGGFGPAGGLFSLDRLVGEYRDLTNQSAGPQAWPATLLPLVDMQPGYDCLDLDSGEIVAWDPQEIEDDSAAAWQSSFWSAAPSLAAWLTQWLDAPDPAERAEQERKAFAETSVRVAIEYYAKLSPAERAAHDLPEVGWEDALRRRYGSI